MSMTVKAYLAKDGGEQSEIRRFSVDPDVASSYEYLINKIPQIFPSLAPGEFNLFWKDPEGDSVAFSSSDELTEALGFVTDGIFRIVIQKSLPCCVESGKLHPNVVCDGCNGGICGSRFKCCVCPDYDLCCQCESKGLHTEHEMWRIREPGSVPSFGPWMHWMKPWKKMMKQNWKHWMSGPGPWGQCPQQRATGTEQPCTSKAETASAQGAGAPSDDKTGASGCKTEEKENQRNTMTPEEAFLGEIGQSVANMMDPLGVDVSVEVETDGKRKRCNAGASGPGWGWGWGRGGGWGGCRRGRWGGGSPRWSFGGCGSFPQQPPPPMSGFWGRAPPPPQNASFQPPPFGFPFGPQAPGATNQTQGCCATKVKTEKVSDDKEANGECMDMEAGSPQPVTAERSEDDWTMVNDRSDSVSPAPENSSQQAPSAPQEPQKTKIQVAMEQLRAMGFEDEGGWLTSLVNAKNGDLNKILDAIRAPERR